LFLRFCFSCKKACMHDNRTQCNEDPSSATQQTDPSRDQIAFSPNIRPRPYPHPHYKTSQPKHCQSVSSSFEQRPSQLPREMLSNGPQDPCSSACGLLKESQELVYRSKGRYRSPCEFSEVTSIVHLAKA